VNFSLEESRVEVAMEEILGVVILLSFCVIVSRLEKTKFHTYVTPFGALAWPFSILVAAINLGGVHFGFFPVSLKSILFVTLCLVFFLLGGYTIAHVFEYRGNEGSGHLVVDLGMYRPLFVSLALASIVGGGLHFLRTISDVGWMNIGSREFKEAMGAGIFAHIVLLSRPSFVFLFADYLKTRKGYILILLLMMFIVVLLKLVKYHGVILILSAIYFSHMHGLVKISLKKSIIYLAFIYLIFNLSYVVGFSTLGLEHAYSSKVQSFLLNHFFTYVFGGPIGLSEIMDRGVYPLYSTEEIFAVPVNIYRFLISNEEMIDIIHGKWLPVSTIHQYFHSTNTFSLFGMAYLFMGTLGTLIYMYGIGSVFYLFHYLSRRGSREIGCSLIHAMNLAFLTISFFGLYFNMLNFFEVWLYVLIIPKVYSVIRGYSIAVNRKPIQSG
jgi:hypothetical protein